MCKILWRVCPEYLEALFGKCIEGGYFPNDWKKARVVVLLKSPDRIRSDPRSYRGISLLPVLGKVLERIMIERLMAIAGNRMSDRQYGFRKERCVDDAWLFVRERVKCSRYKYVLGIFVDFKGAFDYLRWDRVIDRLRELGCAEITLWQSYFSNRTACIVGERENVTKTVERGCPQGSICGPYIWNLMMDSLLHQLVSHCECCAYADDLLLLIEGQSRLQIERKGEECMKLVCDWGEFVGVNVAMEKSHSLLLKGSLAKTRPPIVRVQGVSLKYVTQVKYLGLTISERMCFVPHLISLRDKLLTVVSQVRRILRSDWGLSRRAVRIIYNGLFVACATFGSPVWCDTAVSAVGMKRLAGIQRVLLLGCLPVCRTVSTDAMQVLLGVPPLDLVVRQRATRFKIKRSINLLQNDLLFGVDVGQLDAKGVKMALNDLVLSLWQSRWNSSQSGRVTYRYIPDVRNAVCFTRDWGLAAGFLLTGHGSLNAFLHRRNLSATAGCVCGDTSETWEHVLCHCPQYSHFRAQIVF
jgi:hypothetical protein